MKLIYSTVLLLACVSSKVNSAEVAGRIYHGTEAAPGQFPYVVQIFLFKEDGGSSLCTGSLLNDQWVLSAAHCTPNKLSADVYLGKSQDPVNNETETVLVIGVPKENFVVHPKYDGNPEHGYDLALFKLSQKVDLNKYPNIKTIKLTKNVRVNYYDLYKAVSVGWGDTSNDQPGYTQHLYYANVTIQMHKQCRNEHGASNFQICTTRGPPSYAGTCGGDSGGPLVVTGPDGQPLQVGADSLGLGDCERKEGTLYTYIGPYYKWIRKVIA